jgi:hypothetical protein
MFDPDLVRNTELVACPDTLGEFAIDDNLRKVD